MGATIGTKLYTLFKGHRVGQDAFGNVYYEARKATKWGRKNRWVIYAGAVEPSKVPAEWHGWLHHVLEVPLSETERHSWQQPHLPNLTGTLHRYLPKGLRDGKRVQVTADYQPWQPK